MLHCYIQEVSHITECTYTHDRLTPLPINHKPMLHNYTFHCQLAIDPCNTITSHKSQIVHNAHILMADPYTKAVSHIVECHGRRTPLQSGTDALITITPNVAHLLADIPPSQSSIDALNTTTPNLADLLPQRVFYAKDLLSVRVTISLFIVILCIRFWLSFTSELISSEHMLLSVSVHVNHNVDYRFLAEYSQTKDNNAQR